MVFQVVQDFRDKRDLLDHQARLVTRDFPERLDSPANLDQWERGEVRAVLDPKAFQALGVDPVGPVILGHPVPGDHRDYLDNLETLESQAFQGHPVLMDNPVILFTLDVCVSHLSTHRLLA